MSDQPSDVDALIAEADYWLNEPSAWEWRQDRPASERADRLTAYVRQSQATIRALAEAQRERDEAVRQLRYVLETNDDVEPREFLAHIDHAAIAEGRGK